MKKASRKKATKKHGTIIEAAEPILRALSRRGEVTKYTCGFIKSGFRAADVRVKVSKLSSRVLRLKISGGGSAQEFKVYSDNLPATLASLKEFDS